MDIKSPVAEARNEYTYTAGGQKLKVKQIWNSNYSTSPVIGSTINPTALDISKTTDYVGNMIYENGVLKRVLVDGGYYEGGVYYFYLNDHLGNNRVVANASGGVIQKTHYYPFGMAFAESTEQDKQPYKYNGKELDRLHGVNLYDYSARQTMPDLGNRFTSMNPLAEKYYSISPYAYVVNNPLRFTDPTGMIVEDGDSIYYYHKQTVNSNLSTINELLKGNLSADMTRLLTGLKDKYTSILKEYRTLENSNQIYNIFLGGTGNEGSTYYEQGKVMLAIGSEASAGLIGHELKHAYQYEKNRISFMPGGKSYGTAYDLSDEREAYNRQLFLDAGNTSSGYNYLNQINVREFSNSDILTIGVSMTPPLYQDLPQGSINVTKLMRRQVEEAGKLRYPIPHIYRGADKDFQKGVRRKH